MRFWIAAGVCVCLAGGQVAHADEVDSLELAQISLERLEYEEALRLLELTQKSGSHNPSSIARVYRLAGQAALTIGELEQADLWFTRWCSLDPDAEFPPGTSPKLVERLEADCEAVEHAIGLEGTNVKHDPLGLVVSVRTTGANTAIGLDEYGNVLLEVTLPPPAVTSKQAPGADLAPTREKRAENRPLVRRWETWAGVAGAFGVTALGFGLAARNAQQELDALNATSSGHSFQDALNVESRLRTRSRIANVALVLSGASAITSIILFARTDKEPREVRLVLTDRGVAIRGSL